MGYPGATTSTWGYNERHHKITLRSQGLATGWDLGHTSQAFFVDCDGEGTLPGTKCRMMAGTTSKPRRDIQRTFAYAYVPQDETKPYWHMAEQYVLADRMFASNLDGSFVAHQYAVAAYADRTVDDALTDWGARAAQQIRSRRLQNSVRSVRAFASVSILRPLEVRPTTPG